MTDYVPKKITRHEWLAIVGYGILLGCSSILFWGEHMQIFNFPEETATVEFLSRQISFPVGIFAIGILSFFFPKALNRIKPFSVYLFFFVGGLMLLLIKASGVTNPVFLVLAGMCPSLGSAISFCMFQEVIASKKIYSAGAIVFAAAAVSSLVCFIAAAMPVQLKPWIIFLVFLPVMIVILDRLIKTLDRSHPMFDTVPRQQRERCKKALHELWRPFICIFFAAFVIGVIRVQAASNEGVSQQISIFNAAGLLVIAILLLTTWRFLYNQGLLTKIYLVIFPLVATTFLIFPFFQGAYQNLSLFWAVVVFLILSSLMVISCARTARSQYLNPVFIYGLFAGGVYGASLIGSAVGSLLDEGGGIGFTQLLIIALVAIYVLSFVMMFPKKIAHENKPFEGRPSVVDVDEVSAEEKCQLIKGQYNLSNRETEVLVLLVQGRDIPYISELLFVSQHTVRSHNKNLFTKMGVHSRQELLTLIESVEL